jgi:hypothetical protein
MSGCCPITSFSDKIQCPRKVNEELPMDSAHFERSLRSFQRRTPFRTFTVAFVNGDRFEVDHPEALVIRDGVAVFIAAGGVPTLFDLESVSQLIGEPSGEPAA